jgi:hypothetical protein
MFKHLIAMVAAAALAYLVTTKLAWRSSAIPAVPTARQVHQGRPADRTGRAALGEEEQVAGRVQLRLPDAGACAGGGTASVVARVDLADTPFADREALRRFVDENTPEIVGLSHSVHRVLAPMQKRARECYAQAGGKAPVTIPLRVHIRSTLHAYQIVGLEPGPGGSTDAALARKCLSESLSATPLALSRTDAEREGGVHVDYDGLFPLRLSCAFP